MFLLIPAWGAGVGLLLVFLVEVLSAIKKGLKKQYFIRCFFLILLFILIFLCQKYFYQGVEGEVYSSVSDVSYREVITLGSYRLSGDVDVRDVIKFIFCLFLGVVVVLNRKKLSLIDYKRELGILLLSAFFLQAGLLLLVQFLEVSEFFKFLVGQSGGVAQNHLTIDQFGYRLSLGFYEPSQMSLFMGSVIGAYVSLERNKKKMLMAVLVGLFLFVTSRSITIIFWAGCVHYLLVCSKKMLILFVGFMVAGIGCFSVVKKYIVGFSLFRSLHERSYFPDIDAPILGFLIGFDFGQVYSFIPLVGMVMQVGLVGVVALFFLVECRVRVAILVVLVFTIAPQMWYSLQWLSVAVLYLASSQCQIENASKVYP